MAQERPNVRIWATDLQAPPFWNTVSEDLSNRLTFLVSDANRPWDMSVAKPKMSELGFHFIHVRFLTYGMRDWHAFFVQCWNHLAPGGVLEVLDVGSAPIDPDLASGQDAPAFVRLFWLGQAGCKIVGIDRNGLGQHRIALEAVGFEVLTASEFTMPVGTWEGETDKEKRVGAKQARNYADAIVKMTPTLVSKAPGMNADSAAAIGHAGLRGIGSRRLLSSW